MAKFSIQAPPSSCRRSLIFGALALLAGCATSQHGVITSRSVATRDDWQACEHQVPEEICVRCHPELVQGFKDHRDWCPEHDIPESQCLECHPDLDFSPPLEPPPGADVVVLAKGGEDVRELEPHLVRGKVTLFDFYAAWCPPCRKVDRHLYGKLARGEPFAIRKIDVGSWDSPVAERWLEKVPELPFLVVYGKDGRRVAEISGARFDAIDRALREGATS